MTRKICEITSKWFEYFKNNEGERLQIPWEDTYQLTPEERRVALKSIQEFQVGENSEELHFIKKAKIYALKNNDQNYFGCTNAVYKRGTKT
jgi:hypothetical protein